MFNTIAEHLFSHKDLIARTGGDLVHHQSRVLVRAEGLEPTLLAERAPKARASACFATPAAMRYSLLL